MNRLIEGTNAPKNRSAEGTLSYKVTNTRPSQGSWKYRPLICYDTTTIKLPDNEDFAGKKNISSWNDKPRKFPNFFLNAKKKKNNNASPWQWLAGSNNELIIPCAIKFITFEGSTLWRRINLIRFSARKCPTKSQHSVVLQNTILRCTGSWRSCLRSFKSLPTKINRIFTKNYSGSHLLEFGTILKR